MLMFWTKKEALQARVNSLEVENVSLSHRNRDLETEKVILEDRLKASLTDRDHLWELVTKALDDMKQSYQMQINQHWQKQGEAAPYPDAPHMGDGTRYTPPKNPFIARPMMPSEMVQKVTQDFIKNTIAGLDEKG